eukprot:728184-Prymnesium_polylepis.1
MQPHEGPLGIGCDGALVLILVLFLVLLDLLRGFLAVHDRLFLVPLQLLVLDELLQENLPAELAVGVGAKAERLGL